MANRTVKLTEDAIVAGKIDPQSSSTELNSGWIDMALLGRVLIIINVGAIAATGTLDCDVEQATSDAGAGSKNITGKSMTQMTDADDNKIVLIEVANTDLDVDNGFRYIQLELTPATAASIVSVTILGYDLAYAPGTNIAAVDEVIG